MNEILATQGSARKRTPSRLIELFRDPLIFVVTVVSCAAISVAGWRLIDLSSRNGEVAPETPVFLGAMALVGLLGLGTVISRLWESSKQAKRDAADARDRSELILSAAGEGIYGLDLQGRITFINSAAARMIGRPAEELTGKLAHEVLRHSEAGGEVCHKDTCPIYAVSPDHLTRHANDELFWRKDGNSFPVEYTSTPIRDALGDVKGSVVAFRDLSKLADAERRVRQARGELESRVEDRTKDLSRTIDTLVQEIRNRQRAELALRQSEGRFRKLVDSAPDAMVIADRHGKIILVNDQTEKLFGYARSELVGEAVEILVPEQVRPGHARLREDYVAHPAIRRMGSGLDLHGRHKDGSEIPVEISLSPLETEGEMLVMTSIRDVSQRKIEEAERRELESQLRHSQKMEALGVLAGGVAHDLNNILSPIFGFSSLAQLDLPKDSPVQEHLTQILHASERARGVVQQILTLGRRNEHETKVVALAPVVQEAVDLLAATIPATIQVRQRIDSSGGNVIANATQIHQVVMNLCTNAFQAMETSGGILEITLHRVDVDEETAAAQPGLRAGPYSQLVVRDTGPGMDPAIRERIFDPFFTTKPVGVGTGLGLSVAHGIISRHDGVILCRSELGQGTSFEVYLPLVSDAVAEPAKLSESLPRGTERILFVDDEKAIVSMVKKLLTRLGYQVTGRTSSLDALALFEQSAGAFDLVITDVTMPELSGPELVSRFLSQRGDMPIIMVTGFSAQTTSESVRKLGAEALLHKPFSTADLARTVRDVLDKARL